MRENSDDQPRVPLKTILQNFLNHVDSLESRKRGRDDPYEQEFQSLKAFSDSLKSQSEYSCSEGEKDVNRKKNRYKDILPFDYTRVTLSEYPGVPGSDYINGNYIKGASGSNAYIACQGPLPNTVNDFWRMVVECEVQVIVMACNEQEAGKYKCENYWTEDENEEKQFGKFFLKLLKSREICPDFLVRTMKLRWTSDDGKTEEERTVCQFHYSAWPDHGIPVQVKPLLEMVRLIRDCQASETLPVLVHCSAGCGRTGTICAIDFIWGLLRTGKLTQEFSLYELVRDMRKQRVAMVQTVEQYVLVHRAVKELFQEQLRVIDSHPYENVDGEGRPLGNDNEEVIPDYETIFVKEDEIKNSGEIDAILTQRMEQKRNEEDESTPPELPAKNRSAGEDQLDSSLDKSIEDKLVLFDPPISNGGEKIKKGNLKLTQMENGSWRLEDNDNSAIPTPNPVPSSTSSSSKVSVKKKKSKDSGGDESSAGDQLLRRPSIKKIRAFFQKDRDSKSSETNDSEENKEVLAAISKLPKFEPCSSKSECSSMPNSLDRRTVHQSDKNSAEKTSSKVLSSSENKPLLPVKRSKSMKVISKPVMFLFPGVSNSSTANNNSKELSRSVSAIDNGTDSIIRSESFPKSKKFDFENVAGLADAADTTTTTQNSQRQQDYVNVFVGSDADSVRNNISNYLSTNEAALNKAQSSTDESKLKNCHDFLTASFENAERESEKLFRSTSLSKNRSAESSPMTTLHKTPSGRQLFSSNSTPSNSYNKYSNVVIGSKGHVISGAIQKSVSSPTSTIQKSYCSPAMKPRSEEVSIGLPQKHNYENVDVYDGKADYVNVTLEAQRKLSAASVSQKSRERRNSFREAVQSGSSRKQSYESIWFVGDPENGEKVVYANAAAIGSARQAMPKEAVLTERERIGEAEDCEMADYESVLISPEGRMAKLKARDSQPLHSVSLVSEAMHQQASREDSTSQKPVLRKQCSNSSIHSSESGSGGVKGLPPPYKQPPPPPGTSQSSAAYANVQVRRNSANISSSSKDDSILSRPVQRRHQKNSAPNQTNLNRFSCGDILHDNGIKVKPEIDSGSSVYLKKPIPGIDLDTVAAMMQGGSSRASSNSPVSSTGVTGQPVSAPRAIGRSLAGVISGAAANLRSRFSSLSQQQQLITSGSESPLPVTLPSLAPIPAPTHGEQLPSQLPLTVPGATELYTNCSSFPANYPQRLEVRPVGPRDPPPHFHRKQEYL